MTVRNNMDNNKSVLIAKIKYPTSRIIWYYASTAGVIALVFSADLEMSNVALLILAWTIIFCFYIRVRWKHLYIYWDKIVVAFPAFLFRESHEYRFEDIDHVFFQTVGAFYDDPYFNIKMKSGERKRIRMPLLEMHQIKRYLSEEGVRIKISRYAGEGMGW
jgi:hypothetical protein